MTFSMNEQGPRSLTGIVSNDPLAHLPIDTSISYEPIIMGGSDASIVPEGVRNWDFFQGALLAVVTRLPGSPFAVEGRRSLSLRVLPLQQLM
jgi:hypothetical protein